MNSNKLRYNLSILLLVSLPLLAVEYVPPPTGPYQSSVIVYKNQVNNNQLDKNQYQADNSDQVYKFPSDGLFQSRQRDEAMFITDRPTQTRPLDISKNPVQLPAKQPQVNNPVIPESVPAIMQPTRQLADDFSRNPWSPYNLPSADSYRSNGYQGNWNNPQYSFPQQTPYGYNNQNNTMNSPFNGMPSPWSVMPMQPFFQIDKR